MEVSFMATLNIPDEKKTLSEFEEVRAQLATMGIRDAADAGSRSHAEPLQQRALAR